MQKANHWIFDLDGTLVDSIESYFQTLRDIFEHFKVKYTQDDIERGNDHEVDMMGARDSGLHGVRVMWSEQNHKPSPLGDKHFHKVSDFHSWLQE